MAERAIVSSLLDDDDLAEFAARGSGKNSHSLPAHCLTIRGATDALEWFFPMAHEHLCNRMRDLHETHPHLRFPFENSAFPACTMNLGPQSVSFIHADGGDYPGIPGSVHSFGSFNYKLGGHIIALDYGFFVQFPSGTLTLLSSSGLRNGNTPIQHLESRYSFTQYISGHLMRWIAYGFRAANEVPESEKKMLDNVAGEGWDNQRARWSNYFSLEDDRKQVYDRSRARRPVTRIAKR